MVYGDRSTGCETCDETNLSTASWSVSQMLDCERNDINELEEALEVIAIEVGAIRDEPIDDVHDTLPTLDE